MLACVNDHGALAGLLRQYREYDDAVEHIALAIAKSEPFYTPVKTLDKASGEMMEALKDTIFMERQGCRLSDISPEDATLIHGLLAMHTFMSDIVCKKHPAVSITPPEQSEVDAARGILDCRWQNRDVHDLCELAVYAMIPSEYVRIRYGLEQECDLYNFNERYLMDYAEYGVSSVARRNHKDAETEMCRAAEKAVESIPGVRLPDFYLEYLDRELEKLGSIALSPDSVNDLIHINSSFLSKYGIDKDAPPEERSRQAVKAYCELDARFVKMVGRRPYAKGLLASLKKKSDNPTTTKARTQAARQNHIRNPPPPKNRGKGRKPSF